MKSRVSVPKIFQRGSRWYVRVQVPVSMQERLKRKEYWVSLGTPDKSEALQRATAVTQQKRREIAMVFRRLSDLRETITELTPDQKLALGREAYARHVEVGDDLIVEYEKSGVATLQEFAENRAAVIENLVAVIRTARSDTPHLRIMAHSLMEDNGIRIPEGAPAFQLDLSRFDAAPISHLSDLSFEGQRAFPAQG
jgi:hypothetical protein